jgi:UDP-glucose:(heptosyl)LPS alpha-1,3-glucosyltransferase
MRVALVVERFEPVGGGVEHAVWNVAQGLAEAGDEVHVIARQGHDSERVQLHRVPVPRFWQPLRVAGFSMRAAAEAQRGDFDVVHSFCRTRHQDIFNAGGGSHAHYMQSAYSKLGASLRRASPRHALQLWMEGRIFADPSVLIQCVSTMVRDQLADRFGIPADRLVVVHNGVDVERFESGQQGAARSQLRAELEAEDHLVWLFSGSGWRRKGLDTALSALSKSSDAASQLWVAGADEARPWRRMAQRLGVAERVRFLGERPDLERYYAAADALILPTRYDAFALVVLEAGAAGVPVVVSAAAGAAELVSDCGIVVRDPEDVAGFTDAMDRLSDPALRAQLGEAGRKNALAHDWRSHVEKLRALYARVNDR